MFTKSNTIYYPKFVGWIPFLGLWITMGYFLVSSLTEANIENKLSYEECFVIFIYQLATNLVALYILANV